MNTRFKDVIIALASANMYDQALGRLQLQKFIYLADTISVIWQIVCPPKGHESYKYGPYDYEIQNAVDCLSFQNFVDIKDYKKIEGGKIERMNYKISENGLKLYTSMLENALLKERAQLYIEVAKQVQVRGWENLKALVYAEPTYADQASGAWYHRFDYSSVLKNESLRILLDFERMYLRSPEIKMSRVNFISIFFKLIEQ